MARIQKSPKLKDRQHLSIKSNKNVDGFAICLLFPLFLFLGVYLKRILYNIVYILLNIIISQWLDPQIISFAFFLFLGFFITLRLGPINSYYIQLHSVNFAF